ncbi:hypothetical protein [Polluticoccus soli]|uniref:hypothetical protein n=1 Tax=Polluticoccus soli TaxID=3034150 RepID=UPI0023E0A42D|nr:hypothetical protein [Flavipsychrobacter sp. JY13-12]
MKNKLSTLVKGVLVVASMMLATYSLQSCSKKDQCNDSCINGYCADGDCVCQTGYTGKWCATYKGSSSSSSSSTSSGPDPDPYPSPSSSSTSSSSSSSSSGGGTAMFWSNFQGSPISVYINGSYAGQITQYYSSSPSCGATGCVTKQYSSTTTLSYTAEDDDHSWDGTLSVTSGCNKMCLTL